MGCGVKPAADVIRGPAMTNVAASSPLEDALVFTVAFKWQ